ncbi:MAG: DMT family transporter [candidate division KSB1 bacterium]|nr:DMT family transporter [candidate division KSB1 bacterium]
MWRLGELAALATASCWALGTTLFGEASKRVGAFTTNLLRIPLGAVLLVSTLFVTRGVFWPTWATREQVTLLTASSFLGLVIGDALFFRSVVVLGPRLATLLSTLAPPVAAVVARILLHERLTPLAVAGMVVTLAGVAWVVAEGAPGGSERGQGRTEGVLAGVGAAVGQGVGLVLSKIAMGDTLDSLSATVIRVTTAVAGVWLVAAAAGRAKAGVKALRNRQALAFMMGGALVGPFLGIWLMLTSVKLTATGVASTLMSTTPLLIIPVVRVAYKERPSPRAWLGAAIAVGGIALLFLS